MFTNAKLADVIERSVWTALQVVSAVMVVTFFNLDPKWAPVIAVALAILKGLLATKFGNGTASTLPSSIEPLPPATSSDGQAAVVTSLPEGGSNDPATPGA